MQAAASQTLPASLKGAILMAEGRNVYRSGTKLTPPEVLSIMDGNDALQTYAAGLRQWKSGRNVQIVGAILGIAGIAGTIYGGMQFETEEGEIIGLVALPIGITMTVAGGMVMQIVGGVKKSRGSRKIAQSVDAYNNSRRSVSRVEWDFGVTQQGLLGFVIKF
jgi:hypothetical protein